MMTRAWLWLRSILFRGRLEREMDEEMSMHLERSTDRFRADGFSPGDARVAAYRTFGSIAAIKEDARDARGGRDYAAQTSLFTDVAAWTSSDIVLGVRGSDRSTQETLFSGAATYATSNYFPVLGIRPVHGAGLPASFPDDGGEPPLVAVISYVVWERCFGLAPDVVGRPLKVNDTAVTIVRGREFDVAHREDSAAIVIGAGAASRLWPRRRSNWSPPGEPVADTTRQHVHRRRRRGRNRGRTR